jgi:hypothetical protein
MPVPHTVTVLTQRVFPPQGGQIDLGTLKLQGQLGNLRLLNHRYCLLSLTQNVQPADATMAGAGCGVQASIGPSGKRFMSDANLPPDGFYHLITDDRSELTVY